MGEAKRRKKILGEAYGKKETSGKSKKAEPGEASEIKKTSKPLEKAKRLLAIEWNARIEMKHEQGKYVEEDFDLFENIPSLKKSHFPLKPNLETKTLLLDHIKALREEFWELISQDFEDLEFPEDSEDLEFSEDSEDLDSLELSFFKRLMIQGAWDAWLEETLGLYSALKDKKGFEEECKALKEVLQESWELVKAPDEPIDFEDIEPELEEIVPLRKNSRPPQTLLAIHHKEKFTPSSEIRPPTRKKKGEPI